MLYATAFSTIILLAVLVGAQNKDDGHTRPDSWSSGSQNIYKLVNVPVKNFKYISPLRPDYQLRPLLKSKHPVRYVKPKKLKPLFTPDTKYIGYTNYRLASLLSKGSLTKFPEIYKPIHTNFNTDLATVKLPSLYNEKQKFEFGGLRYPNPYRFKHNHKLHDVPNLYDLHNDFLESASPKQIEKYLEDQQKLQDEKIELQLLNDPNPEAKGKYQQFLKAKEDEKIEKDYIEELKKKDRHHGSSYVPIITQEPKPVKKSETPGLRHYRTQKTDPSAYEFEITLP